MVVTGQVSTGILPYYFSVAPSRGCIVSIHSLLHLFIDRLCVGHWFNMVNVKINCSWPCPWQSWTWSWETIIRSMRCEKCSDIVQRTENHIKRSDDVCGFGWWNMTRTFPWLLSLLFLGLPLSSSSRAVSSPNLCVSNSQIYFCRYGFFPKLHPRYLILVTSPPNVLLTPLTEFLQCWAHLFPTNPVHHPTSYFKPSDTDSKAHHKLWFTSFLSPHLNPIFFG